MISTNSSRSHDLSVARMESTMVVFYLVLCLGLIGANGTPLSELRSNLEFLPYQTNLDEPAYRLLDNVQPRYMNVDLDVYLNESRFNGFVQIQAEVLEANLTQLVLHQNLVYISTVTVFDSNNVSVPLEPFEIDSYYELLKINLGLPIPVGNYTILISYLGRINQNPFDRGFYMGYYYYNNQIRYYATTQFQPFHARKAFPCFDEPQFKCPFVISITRDSSLSQSYSNMAIGNTQIVSANRIRETFLPTPIISAYLVAFHVSDFIETNATGTIPKPFSIISRPGVENQHGYAADIGVKITNELDQYLAINYHDMGQGQPMKNDHIALPDFPSGAMENWGIVNYREAYLLYDENNTNIINKIFIATIIAHEMAHKWFGNLVTCFWWSNLWLNESYASFFEYFAAHYADPTLELDDQFVVDYVHSALTSDASASATPMNWTEVVNNPSVSAHFSTTSYAKGASVLRMLEHFVGPITFRNALRNYLNTNAYGIGTPEDMYAGFRTAVAADSSYNYNVDIGDVFDSWVQNPGAPVLNVTVNMDTGVISFTQSRYQLSGTPPSTLWRIPISWTHQGSPDFTNTKPSMVLTAESGSVTMPAGHNWVIFNIAQSGLYRVYYDDHNYEMLAAYLRSSERETIHKLNRAQIVNDILFFIRSGHISISRAFDVLSFLENETDYYVWAGALTQLDWIRRRLEHLPAAYNEFTEYLLKLMETVIENLGYEERESDSTSTILNRMQIMNFACNLGHSGCITDSLSKWNAFRQNNNNLVPVNARRYVYCTGLRQGTAEDYQFLFDRYEQSENTADMVVMLRALGCTQDVTSLNHYLQETLYNGRIRLHDRSNAYQYALQGNRGNLQTVLNFTYANYNEIRELYGGEARLSVVVSSLASYLTDFQDIVNFQSWLYQNQVEIGSSFATGVSVINSGINNLNWGNQAASELYAFLLGRSSATALKTPIYMILAVVTAYFLRT